MGIAFDETTIDEAIGPNLIRQRPRFEWVDGVQMHYRGVTYEVVVSEADVKPPRLEWCSFGAATGVIPERGILRPNTLAHLARTFLDSELVYARGGMNHFRNRARVRPDDETITRIVLDAMNNPDAPAARVTLHAVFGVEKTTADDWIRRVRDLGLVPPATKGPKRKETP